MTVWEMYLEDFEVLKALPGRLLCWYDGGHRDLPWRRDKNPYHIWVSEIMLQQTRVEAVKGYYARFLRELPTIEALAEAEDDRLRKLWEGLGYYTRVRNLKKAAQIILSDHGGQFPGEYEAVRALPGIGDYTAGAICSIAFGLPTPAVDGNVLRVMSRLLTWQEATDLPEVKKRAGVMLGRIYPQDRPGDFTQALMELGATLCGPKGQPDCGHCPMKDLCRANAAGTQLQYPVRLPKKQRRQEEKTVFLLRCGDCFALERREEKGLLAGLWQFPHVPGFLKEEQAMAQAEAWGVCPSGLLCRWEREHIFTHIHWKMWAYRMDCDQMPEHFTWLTRQEIRENAALPTAFRQFWDLVEEQEG